jgi:hypothetical protein
MWRKYLPLAVAFASAVLVVAPTIASAAVGIPTIVPCGGTGQSACTVCDLAKVAQNILNAGIYLAVILSAVLFAWAGFLYLTNVGNSSGVARAKEIFSNILIGLVIILASWLVIDIVMRTFVGASILPWNSLC